MNWQSYHNISGAIIVGAPSLVLFVGFYLVMTSKNEWFILIALNGIVTKKNYQNTPGLFICGRKLSFSKRKYFVTPSALIVGTCIQTVLYLCIIEVSYECRDDPKFDCYKVVRNLKFGEAPPRVNCTAISSADLVQCYRLVLIDSEKIFIAFSAAYLLFKIFQIGLLIVTNFMLWIASKGKYCIKICQCCLVLVAVVIPCFFLILPLKVKEFENSVRDMSFARFFQISFVITMIIFYIWFTPWKEFTGLPEYLENVSLPVEDQVENDNAVWDVD